MNEQQDLPITIVIFGASGDLTHRKLIPSLFSLYRKDRLPKPFQITGFSVDDWDDKKFRESLYQGLIKFAGYPVAEGEWKKFADHLTFVSGNFTEPKDFAKLKEHLQSTEKGPTGRIYYMATPPRFFPDIAHNLSQEGMLDETEAWRRVVIEKPFGSDYDSAHQLNQTLHKEMEEEQIFRIDHYLGKETVQNILVFRFANTIFEPVWCSDYIESVQISVAETVGVEHRAGYYEKAGVVRDMFQNHILQLLTLIAIEPPDTFRHKDLHARKREVLRALRPIEGEAVKENTVRGQYRGYRKEPGVDPNSQTATFAAIRAFIDNPRWQGVPFYLRSGKELQKKCTEIIIQFKCPKFAVFPLPESNNITPNLLAMCIQPDEGIFLRFEAKVPDTEADMRSVEMEFHYSTSFGTSNIPDAYERLILEIIQGDHTLFTQDDTTELAWKWIDPILAAWQGPDLPPLQEYEPATWGPEASDQLLALDNCTWQITCGQHGDQ